MPGNSKIVGSALCHSPRRVAQHTTTQNFGSSRVNLQFSHQNPIFDPLDPKFDPQTCLLVYILLKTIINITNMKSKHQFTSKSSLSSFFTKNPKFSVFIQNSQTTTQIQTPSIHVSTIIIHQFMLHTWISKNHQNNLSTTTTTMNSKHITHQIHRDYHNHKFTWIKSTEFIIKIYKKTKFINKDLFTKLKRWT